ncbi:MAG: cytochrome c3 family protein [Desulfovibrionales bacterium]|nr:cytochrome c3 family protein [Desulfovibrionales bacterium]
MKRIGFFALIAAVLGCGAVMAASFEIPESVTMSASRFEGYTPKKGDVTFNHASHLQIPCADCHHTVPDTYTIESCMTEGCHDNIKTRGEVNSAYTAFHTTKDTTKSCVGCHRELKRNGPSDAPLTCNSCHIKE